MFKVSVIILTLTLSTVISPFTSTPLILSMAPLTEKPHQVLVHQVKHLLHPRRPLRHHPHQVHLHPVLPRQQMWSPMRQPTINPLVLP